MLSLIPKDLVKDRVKPELFHLYDGSIRVGECRYCKEYKAWMVTLHTRTSTVIQHYTTLYDVCLLGHMELHQV